MRKVYYTTFENMIVALNIRFNQKTIEMIKNVAMLLNLQIRNENINLSKDTFDTY